jgi:hypothetical protein
MASIRRVQRPIPAINVALGTLSFGFGWWYYAHTEGAAALA